MDRLNTYSATFIATCPSDSAQIIYQLLIQAREKILVEHINTATALIKQGHQEDIADQLHERLGGHQTIKATHQGVEITTTRGAK